MLPPTDAPPVFRFAPSPNGLLHLGHALSALTNFDMARAAAGRFLLRIEDIDRIRSNPQFERAVYHDLAWLGLEWEEPVRRQSAHFGDYRDALKVLVDADLVYPAFETRGDVRARVAETEAAGRPWPRDPDGVPLYPAGERDLTRAEREDLMRSGMPYAWRLDMEKALAHVGRPLTWIETGAGPDGETGEIAARPEMWGDVVLARKDAPTGYHIAVTVDDALQGVTNVVRGRDLFHATSVHRLLQELLGLPEPVYHHHRLILAGDGRKLSKSRGDTALAALREAGMQPGDIRRLAGLAEGTADASIP